MKEIRFPLVQNTSCCLIYEPNSLITNISFKNLRTYSKIKKKKLLCLQGNIDIILLLTCCPLRTDQTDNPIAKMKKEQTS